MEVIAKKISKRSLFKLLFIGLFFGLSIFTTLCGIAAFFGADTVSWNGVHKTGVMGLLYGIMLGPIMTLFFSCFLWVFIAFGLWIYSFFRPLRLTFKKTGYDNPNAL